MKRSAYAYPYLLWMALFIVVPLAIVLFYALTDTVDGRLIFTLENFSAAFDPAYVKVFLRSLWMAALATVICLATTTKGRKTILPWYHPISTEAALFMSVS